MSTYLDAQGAGNVAASKFVDDAIAAAVAAAAAPLQAQLTAANTSLAQANADLAAAQSDDQTQIATVTQLRGQVAQLLQQVASLEAQLAAAQDPPPDDPPPAIATVFSAVPGPATQGGTGGTAQTRQRVAAAFGVPVLPVDRVYSSTGYGKATASPSPLVAVSYAQVPGLAKGDAATIKALTAELQTLKSKTGQKWDIACDHEVDAEIRKGSYTGADLAKAAARFKQVVEDLDAPNVRAGCCYTGYVFTLKTTDPSHPANYFDPDSYDFIALDPYWPGQPSAAAAFDAGWTWASQFGKRVPVWETGYQTGSAPQSPTEAQLTTKVTALRDYWNTRAPYVLWYESFHAVSNLLEGHPAALAVWAAAVQGK